MASKGLLPVLAAGLLLALNSAETYAQISGDTIRIGVLADMSGVYKDIGGTGSVVAAELAVAEFGGHIDGKRIEIVSADGQNKPDIASSIARKWYDQDGVDMIVDLPASSVALAVQELARQRGKINIVTGGGISDLTGKFCSPTGFHWVYDTYANSFGTGEAAVKAGGKTWYFITGDFAAGYAFQRETTAAVEANGGKVLGSVRHPFPNNDFSSQLLSAQQSGAQVVALANAGQDMITAIKQAREFGLMDKQRLIGLIVYISEIHALGLDVAGGMQFLAGFYHAQSPEALAWSRIYAQRMGGAMPGAAQAGVYSAVRHYLQAIKAIGTDEGIKVAEQMRKTPINDMFAKNGRLRIDGRMVHDMLLAQVKTPAESKGPWDYLDILLALPGDSAFRPLDAGGCPLFKG